MAEDTDDADARQADRGGGGGLEHRSVFDVLFHRTFLLSQIGT